MSESLLEVSGLSAGYGMPVLSDVTLTVNEGEIVALVGSNGAGKTTLLRAISRTIAAEGTLRFNGMDLMPMSPEKTFLHGLVQVPEGRQLFGKMTVRENLLLGADRRRGKKQIVDRFARVYKIFPMLAERRNQLAGSMSGGEQQMCAIGRALMASPILLTIDEMSLGLAPVIVDELLTVLSEIRKDNTTVLIVEQDVFAAFSIADRAYVMEDGRIVKHGNVQELEHDPEVQRAYLGVA